MPTTKTVRTDNERRYTGTNFAVMALVVLMMLVGGYFLVAQISDVADDPANLPLADQYSSDNGVAAESR